jgi:hypothetical protein
MQDFRGAQWLPLSPLPIRLLMPPALIASLKHHIYPSIPPTFLRCYSAFNEE